LEAIPGSIDSIQKAAILGTSNIIRKVLQSETGGGGDHHWFKRSTRKKRSVTRDNNNIIIIIIIIPSATELQKTTINNTHTSFLKCWDKSL
jgi:hypothetical protein